MFFLLLVFLSNEHFLVCFSATVIKKKKTNQSQLRQGRDYYILQIVVHHQGKPQKQFSRNWRQELKQRPGTVFSLPQLPSLDISGQCAQKQHHHLQQERTSLNYQSRNCPKDMLQASLLDMILQLRFPFPRSVDNQSLIPHHLSCFLQIHMVTFVNSLFLFHHLLIEFIINLGLVL